MESKERDLKTYNGTYPVSELLQFLGGGEELWLEGLLDADEDVCVFGGHLEAGGHERLEKGGVDRGPETRNLARRGHLTLEQRVRVSEARPREHRGLEQVTCDSVPAVTAT